MIAWRCEELAFRYPGASRAAVDGVSLEVPAGACTAIIGPNGSGKSTLLRLLLGTLVPHAGSVWLGEVRVAEWSRAEMARTVGVVPQGEETIFPVTVRELVAMGRYPHLGGWRREGAADRQAIADAMRRCDIAEFAARMLDTLSGGERQRVRVARALAQQGQALALDEPTVALDIAKEMAVWELLRELGRDGVTVLLITHNLNLAARYADQLILLDGGQVAAHGTPREVLTPETVERVYRWPVEITTHAGAPQVVPLSGHSEFAEPAELSPRTHESISR
ncbi:iron-enterobactin ABC transporter ATP-binding protein [soil metagenome]